MPLIQAIVLGIVQGLTEFLPISSTAHLILIPWLFGWKDPGLAFDVALHVGTLAAILIYFFRDWVQVIAQGLGMRSDHDPALSRNPGLLWLMVGAGSAGALLTKLTFSRTVERRRAAARSASWLVSSTAAAGELSTGSGRA